MERPRVDQRPKIRKVVGRAMPRRLGGESSRPPASLSQRIKMLWRNPLRAARILDLRTALVSPPSHGESHIALHPNPKAPGAALFASAGHHGGARGDNAQHCCLAMESLM